MFLITSALDVIKSFLDKSILCKYIEDAIGWAYNVDVLSQFKDMILAFNVRLYNKTANHMC